MYIFINYILYSMFIKKFQNVDLFIYLGESL